jgi:hypothetical protein
MVNCAIPAANDALLSVMFSPASIDAGYRAEAVVVDMDGRVK